MKWRQAFCKTVLICFNLLFKAVFLFHRVKEKASPGKTSLPCMRSQHFLYVYLLFLKLSDNAWACLNEKVWMKQFGRVTDAFTRESQNNGTHLPNLTVKVGQVWRLWWYIRRSRSFIAQQMRRSALRKCEELAVPHSSCTYSLLMRKIPIAK